MPSFSISGLMSEMSTEVVRSAYFSRAWSSIRIAMSPVPPAMSNIFMGPLLPGFKRDTKSSFHSRWTPIDIASFIRSYFGATEEKTPFTLIRHG